MKNKVILHPHYLGHRDRLRKRFLNSKGNGLQDYELMELLLTFSIPRKDTKPIAKRLLAKFRNISGILDADLRQLKEINGIGETTIVLIKVVKYLLEFYLKEELLSKEKISSPEAVVKYYQFSMGGLKDEQFRAVYLNSKNQLIAEEVIQEGTVDHAVVYPRKVLEHALLYKASGIIIVHNHPSGSLEPSKSDIELTKRLRRAAKEMDIKIHDHLIITKKGYYSFYENSLI